MTRPTEQSVNVGRVYRRQALVANIMRACPHCGAPGFWHDTPGVNVGCYAPDKLNQPVGKVCPNCGKPRPGVEARGVIWSKVWKTGLWSVLKGTLSDLVKPLRRTKQ